MTGDEALAALAKLIIDGFGWEFTNAETRALTDAVVASLVAHPETVMKALDLRLLGYVDDWALRNDGMFHTITVDVERESNIDPMSGMLVYAFPDGGGRYDVTFADLDAAVPVPGSLPTTLEGD